MKKETKAALIQLGNALKSLAGGTLIITGPATYGQLIVAAQQLIDAADAEPVDDAEKVSP